MMFVRSPYHSAELPNHGAQPFYILYFLMTGLHAIHLVIGIVGLMAWLVKSGARPSYHPGVEMAGFYWHLIDCFWIFPWPIFYLNEMRIVRRYFLRWSH